MPLLAVEQAEIENAIDRALRDVSRPNPYRLKAGLRVLLTTDLPTFENVCSEVVQKELNDFKKFLAAPEILAPELCRTEPGKQEAIAFIKQYALGRLQLLDTRVAILPNTTLVQKSIIEGEHLKSVVHASALRNVVTNAHHFDQLRADLLETETEKGKIDMIIENAIRYTKELQGAVLEGNISHILQCLSHHGVDINLPDGQGMTPLHLAVREGLTETVKLLLTVPNIKPNPVSNTGWTPLQTAARLGHADIVDALLAMTSVDPNAVNSDGWSALHWAAWHGFPETVTVLLTAPRIKINLVDKNQTAPIHLAARNGHADVISLLLSRREIEVNRNDDEQRTPLHLAAMYNHEGAVRVLLSVASLEVNHKDRDGLTPLHWVARHGYLHILKALLAHPNISLQELDNSGLTPLQWAIHNGHNAAKQCLKPRGTQSAKGLAGIARILNFFKKIMHI